MPIRINPMSVMNTTAEYPTSTTVRAFSKIFFAFHEILMRSRNGRCGGFGGFGCFG
jgi:hypothetical protein